MNERILLDTDVVIRLLRQQPETKISFIYYYEQGTVFLLSLEDYLLAATAKIEDYQLWTYNRKHFPMPDVSIFKA
jgi:predicted nucleic acid-binding protein